MHRRTLLSMPMLRVLAGGSLQMATSAVVAQTPSAAVQESAALPLPAVGTPWGVPELDLLDGTRFLPSQADGHVLVIYWWASTCPFCALQSPYMQTLWQANRTRGLRLLTLSIDKTPAAAETYMKVKGYTFPAGWVTPEVQRAMPKPKGLPITLVRGRDGKLLLAERGQMFPEDVQAIADLI